MFMDKVYITNQVKQEILDICGLTDMKPYNLNGLTSLFTLGCNTRPKCRLVANKLQEIAVQYNTGRLVEADTISADLTVNECVSLILKITQ